MAIRNVLVAGAGQMGTGIAQVALQAGMKVTLFDIAAEQLDRARARIDAGLAKADKRGKLNGVTLAEAQAALTLTTDLCARDMDLAIEAAPESEPLKRDLIARLFSRDRQGLLFRVTTVDPPANIFLHFGCEQHTALRRTLSEVSAGKLNLPIADRTDLRSVIQGTMTIRTIFH